MLELTYKIKYKLTARETFLFKKVADKALGKKYDLSLVICGDKLTNKHNVLSYPLSKDIGEIFLNPKRAKPFTLTHLFIHAVAHLKGFDHSPAMDKFAQKLL